MIIAEKTLAKIESFIRADQGASFRQWSGRVLPHIDDAYSPDTFPFRSHMGASLIGRKCAREIWYGFRWSTLVENSGRLNRLFNRGHLEEGRFIAMLLMIGCEVYQQDEHGKQFRISDAGGHFGGSGDGIVVNLPDLPEGTAALCEFKTSGDKPFQKLIKEGVKESKPDHYVQMNVYMGKMGYPVTLYMCVNKNTDELYAELIYYDKECGDRHIDRAINLVFLTEAPEGICKRPGWWEGKFCDHKGTCQNGQPPCKNCRTCKSVSVEQDGTWVCKSKFFEGDNPLSKDAQLKACDRYMRAF